MKNNFFVFDTNVLVSANLFPRSIPAQALRKAQNLGFIIFSIDTFNEFSSVLQREKFNKYLPLADRKIILNTFVKYERIVFCENNINICSDPKDNMFLSLALECQADCIVSGDKHLLELHPFEHIPIVTPTDFLHL